VLTETDEAVVVEFRRRTLLPLDDVPGCLRDSITNLRRRLCIASWCAMASHRCSSVWP
jgi:hypothetical protein